MANNDSANGWEKKLQLTEDPWKFNQWILHVFVIISKSIFCFRLRFLGQNFDFSLIVAKSS